MGTFGGISPQSLSETTMTDQYVTRAALARWLTGKPLTKCRVTVKTEPPDVVLNDKRNGTRGQKPGQCILHGGRHRMNAFFVDFYL